MKRRVGYKRQFREMSYKTFEDVAVVVDTVVEKMNSCKNIKELNKVVYYFPLKNKDFWNKVIGNPTEQPKGAETTIALDSFVRNLQFKATCIIEVAIIIANVNKLENINIEYCRKVAEDRNSSFNLPNESHCLKSLYRFMDIIKIIQDNKVYEKFKCIPEKYKNLILLEIKTLTVLLEKYTQRVAKEQGSSEKIDRMIEEVDKVREQIPVEELECEVEGQKLSYARIWNSRTKSEGEIIDEQKYNDIIKDKDSYDIFVIDKGAYRTKSAGDVYLLEKRERKAKNTKGKRYKKVIRKELKYRLPYMQCRILTHTLRNNGIAGDIFTLFEKCWDADIKYWHKLYEDDRNTFWNRTRTYRKTIGKVSKVLQKIKVKLTSEKTGVYELRPMPVYCVVEVI